MMRKCMSVLKDNVKQKNTNDVSDVNEKNLFENTKSEYESIELQKNVLNKVFMSIKNGI